MVMRMMTTMALKQNLSLIPSYCSFPKQSASNLQILHCSLIKSTGFSSKRIGVACKPNADVAPVENLDPVSSFFKVHGFTDTDIRSIISKRRKILSQNVETAFLPNLEELHQMGFADSDLRKLIVADPYVLYSPSAIERIKFWTTFLKGDKKKIIQAIGRNCHLMQHNLDTAVIPKFSFLKDRGFSEDDIRSLVVRGGLIIRSTSSIEALIKKVEELGFRPGSASFMSGMWCLGKVGYDLFLSRMELYKSFGWSKSEFLAAFRKFPNFVNLSEENVRAKMEFLVGKAGCVQSYIAFRPMILNYSLEKRLMPRHHVVNILKSNDLIGRQLDFYSVISTSEKKFVDKFILKYRDTAPTLLLTYISARAGEILL